MPVRIQKPAVNIREKLAELERPIGLKGSELMRAETVQDARDFVSAGRKNLIINGDFKIWQRGPEVKIADFARGVCADMWRIYGQTGGAKATATRVTDVPANQGFTYALQFQHSIDGVQSSTSNELVAHIEVNNPSTSMAPFIGNSTYTLSYWAKTNNPDAVKCSRVRFAENINGSGSQNVSFTQITNHTGSGRWEKLEVRIQMFADANFTPISFTTLRIYFGNGNYTGQHLFTGVQLEVGKNATEFEHRSYGEELALCQRYYQAHNTTNGIFNSGGVYGWMAYPVIFSSSGYGSTRIMLPTTMRTNPSTGVIGSISNNNTSPIIGSNGTIGLLVNGLWAGSTGTGLGFNTINPSETTTSSFRVDVSGSGFTAGNSGLLYFYGTEYTSTVTLSAEL
jgi:hypothetical protein